MASITEVLALGPGSQARFGLANAEESYLRTVTFHDDVQNANTLWARGNAAMVAVGGITYGQPPLTNLTLTQLPGGGAIEVRERTWRGQWIPLYRWSETQREEEWYFESDATTPVAANEKRKQIVTVRRIQVIRYNFTTYNAAIGSWDTLQNTTNDAAFQIYDRTYPANTLLFTDSFGSRIRWGVYNKINAVISLYYNKNGWRESYIKPSTNAPAWRDSFQRTTFPTI